jgi:hypothetical protein
MRRGLHYTLVLLAALVAGATVWAWQFTRPDPQRWTLPLRAGGVTWHVPVVTAIRLATTPLAGRLFHGSRLATRYGQVELSWRRADAALQLRCAPCRIDAPMLSTVPIEVPVVVLTVQRAGDHLTGRARIGTTAAGLSGEWDARLTGQTMQIALRIAPSPAASFYGVFGAAIPENRHARIEGRFALQMTLRLPDGALRIAPELNVEHVDGLGTAALRGAKMAPSCSRTPLPEPATTTRPGRGTHGSRALVAAVLAAEDQRFHEHRGYDPAEIAAALALNTRRQAPARGASTITQQVAKLLFVGAERTHVRKLRELLYAVEMERTLGKAQILQLYLAVAPWGNGICGAQAAAQHYFGKRVADLRVAEAASMAALLRNPERELTDPAAHLERARWIAGAMVGIRGPRSVEASAIAALHTP